MLLIKRIYVLENAREVFGSFFFCELFNENIPLSKQIKRRRYSSVLIFHHAKLNVHMNSGSFDR